MVTTVIKRKNIDLPIDTLQKLSLLAVAHGKSLKAYIESILIAKANTTKLVVSEDVSPSADDWFDNERNMSLVREGVEQYQSGRTKAYTLDEIRDMLMQ